MKKITLAFMAAFLVLLNACNKNELDPKVSTENITEKTIDMRVEDGILTFATEADFAAVFEEVAYKTSEDINAYFAEKGFDNLASKYDALFDQINTIDEDEIVGFVRNHPKYLSLKDLPNGEQEIVRTSRIFEDVFANEDFIYQIGDEVKDVRTIQANQPQTLRNCNNPHIEEYIRNENGCSKDRKAILEARVLATPNWSRTNIYFYMELRGQRKRACIWSDYKTQLDFVGHNHTIQALINGTTSLTGTLGSGIHSHYNANEIRIWAGASVPATGSPATASISSALGQGTTRGIGANVVEINCQ